MGEDGMNEKRARKLLKKIIKAFGFDFVHDFCDGYEAELISDVKKGPYLGLGGEEVEITPRLSWPIKSLEMSDPLRTPSKVKVTHLIVHPWLDTEDDA